jgi:hypothetical protein
LTQPDDAISATDVLKPGASGPSFTLAMRPTATEGVSADTADSGAPVEAVPVSSDSASAPGNNLGVSIIEAPNGAGGDAAAAPSAAPAPEAAPAAADPSAPPTITLQPATASGAPASVSTDPGANVVPEASGNTQATTGTGGGTIAPVVTAPEKAAKADTKTESTSKKKKGIHRVIPF